MRIAGGTLDGITGATLNPMVKASCTKQGLVISADRKMLPHSAMVASVIFVLIKIAAVRYLHGYNMTIQRERGYSVRTHFSKICREAMFLRITKRLEK
jgi:hypothetical protein